MSSAIASPAPDKGRGRARLLMVIVCVFLALGVAWAAWWYAVGRWYESTDDAYVGGNVVQVTPQVSGTVVAIQADDTEFVKAGQPLVELDKADSRVALERAETQLARAVRQVRNLFATNVQLAANVEVRRTELQRAQEDVARRERVTASGAVSVEELEHARDAVRNSQAALVAAEKQLEANRVLVDRTTVREHPDVQNAAAQVREAYLAWARTVLPAPVSGYVAKRNVQLGQRVAAGTPLMAVVPLEQVWVDANFKEGQLTSVRVGQPAALHADLYGSAIEYHGKVAGFGAGTGAVFALLPAQNATGNWIKVVQRVAVRITLDPKELAAHPLQLGLSMRVEVDTTERGGERLPQVARTAPGAQTRVFGSAEELAAKRIEQIIVDNGGEPARGAAAKKPAPTS
jgi:membrane fusion protein, multidrug efflux system